MSFFDRKNFVLIWEGDAGNGQEKWEGNGQEKWEGNGRRYVHFRFFLTDPKLNCIHSFPIDFKLREIPFTAKSIGKVQLQSECWLIWQGIMGRFVYTQINLFETLLNQTKIRLYLPFSD